MIAKPLTTTNRTRFSSCITSSGNLDLVSNEVANSLLLNMHGPVCQYQEEEKKQRLKTLKAQTLNEFKL